MPAALAKLRPPRLTHVVRRERLHRLLDADARPPVIWFGAAAGTGKTTAAAEYVASRKTPLCWYRVDAGDVDLASFFFYLARAAPAGRSKKALPIFGPEFAEQPVIFARRFFRDFFARLPGESALVFDDIHVAAETLLPAIIAIAIEELPPDFRLFLLSRAEPPSTFAGFRATDRLGVVDESALRFDDDEAAALIRRRLGVTADDRLQQRLQAEARGWAAGLVLLSEQAASSGAVRRHAPEALGQVLFDYFAREVVGNMSDADQEFMELSALLWEFTPRAAVIATGRDDAQHLLEDLTRRQLFVTRVADKSPRYQYHDLFREFLLQRLTGRIDPEVLNAARLRAVDAALADDQVERATALCLDAGAWERAVALVCEQARGLVRQGRRVTLRVFAGRIPRATAVLHPWLDYWLGVASMIDDATVALEHFERAWTAFTGSSDSDAACLTAAQAVLGIHMSWATNVGGFIWVKRLDRSPAALTSLGQSDRLRVTAALVRAAAMDDTYRVNEESIAIAVESALLELEGGSADIDASDRLIVADILQEHALNTGQPALFERTVAAVTPYLTDRSLTSWARCHWLISFGLVSGRRYPYRKAGFPYATAEAALQEAWTTCQREGLPDLRFAATTNLINVARAAGDDDQARTLLVRLDAECNPARPTQVSILMGQKAMQFARDGRYNEALAAVDASLAAGATAQLPTGELWNDWLARGQILIALDRCQEAAALMHEHALRFSGVFMQAMSIVAASADTWAARRDGAPGYIERLRHCMADVRAMGWHNYMTTIPLVVAQLWSDALDHGIERDFIVEALRRRRLPPPKRYTPAWPWPVRVRVLGGVNIECDDVPVRFAGKVQFKPLELLKVLAVAPQHRVDQRQVERWLWPDAAESAAKKALEAAVHRLRKLLRCDEAVLVAAGKVQLSATHVWVDAAAFEAWLVDAQRELDARPGTPVADLLAERLFGDYCGRLFGDDLPTPWSIGPRERLHNKFLQLVHGLGRFHEVHLDWARAGMVYERGLAQDQVVEAFYRGLIRCQLARNEPAAALHTFRRCREILSVVLGVAPAQATRALVAKVTGA
jgi:LuxR family transcriptional regulator, maltose regulon positive regulatory protein